LSIHAVAEIALAGALRSGWLNGHAQILFHEFLAQSCPLELHESRAKQLTVSQTYPLLPLPRLVVASADVLVEHMLLEGPLGRLFGGHLAFGS